MSATPRGKAYARFLQQHFRQAEAAERNGRANRVLLDALLGPGGNPSSTPGPVI